MPQYVPNKLLQIAANLRFNDTNGNLVTQLYAINPIENQPDTPETGYISLIGSHVNTLIDQYNSVINTLTSYNTRITNLETSVTAILTSGATQLPLVNGSCFSGNTSISLATASTYLIANSCDYNQVLGTPTALATSILAQCSGLNTADAFSQNSAMAGLAGWISSPSTIADTITNQWKAYCDIRAGVTTALAAVTPTCAQVIVDYQVVSNTPLTFVFYFGGYSFIPSGYTDNGSLIKITDTTGNIYQTGFDIVAASQSNTPITLFTSGSTLSPTSPTYQIEVDSDVTNSSIGVTCYKVKIIPDFPNPDYPPAPSGNSCCPDIGNYTASQISGTTAITLTSALPYTPRFGTWTAKNAFTAAQVNAGGSPPYLTYSLGTVVLHIIGGTSATGTFDIDWLTHR